MTLQVLYCNSQKRQDHLQSVDAPGLIIPASRRARSVSRCILLTSAFTINYQNQDRRKRLIVRRTVEEKILMEKRILLIDEVAKMVEASPSSISRWCEESRKGLNTFPLPVSARGGKRRWLLSDIEQYLESLSTVKAVPARKPRRNAKAHAQRQSVTDRALAKYRTSGDEV